MRHGLSPADNKPAPERRPKEKQLKSIFTDKVELPKDWKTQKELKHV